MIDSQLHGFFWNGDITNNYIGHQMAEVYKERVYDRYFSGKSGLTVLELGSNIGIVSYYLAQFAKIVYAVEPSKEHFDVLIHQLAFNHLTNVLPFNVAISNTDGEATFYHQQNKTMFSLHPPGVDPSQATEVVKTVRLDTFFSENHIEHIDFVKCDVEGSEADIICGDAFQTVAPKIDTIFLERHSWNGRHPNQLTDALKQAGFTKIEQIPNQADLLICTKE